MAALFLTGLRQRSHFFSRYPSTSVCRWLPVKFLHKPPKTQRKTIVNMPPKRKGAAAKVAAQADVMEEKAADIGDQPKVKKGRQAKEPKEEEVPIVEEKPKRGRGGRAAKENNVVAEEEPEVVKPKGRGRKAAATSSEKSESNDEEESVSEEEVAAVPEEPKRRGRQAAAAEKSDTNGVKRETRVKKDVKKDEPKPSKEEIKAAKDAAKAAKDEAAKAAKEAKAAKSTGKAKKATKSSKDEEEDVEDEVEDQPEEEKPTGRRGRAAKKPADKPETAEEPKAKKVRGGKKSADSETAEPALQNQTASDYSNMDFACTKENAKGNEANFKISSWNVDGIRAWIKKDGLMYLEKEDPDIICLQETKCSEDKLPEEINELENYKKYWVASEKDGYAGVALFTKTEPIEVKYGLDVEEHDDEGRCITAEYETFYLVCVYVPNAGRKLVTLPKRLEWNTAFKDYVLDLDKKKPVIVCGDMNVAHEEIDLSNPKTNKKNAGFTEEEREGMTDFLGAGFVDTFRKFYPEQKDAYTFWSYITKARSKNIGWRLDYFLVSERFVDSICDNVIRSEVFGSDHCPITLFLTI